MTLPTPIINLIFFCQFWTSHSPFLRFSLSHIFFCFLFFPVFLLFVWARGTCVCLFDWMWLYSSYFILFCIFICNCNFGYIVSKIELESSTSIISQRELSKCSDMSWWTLTWSRGLAASGQSSTSLSWYTSLCLHLQKAKIRGQHEHRSSKTSKFFVS